MVRRATRSGGGGGAELVLLIPEAAEILRTSTDTVRRMIHDGTLEAHKIRNQWRIPRFAVDQLVQPNGKPTKRAPAQRTSSKPKATTKTTARSRTGR